MKLKDCKYNAATKIGFLGQVVFIDLVGPLTEVDGFKHIMTLQDGFTNFVQAFPVRNKEAETTANMILNQWISVHGCI